MLGGHLTLNTDRVNSHYFQLILELLRFHGRARFSIVHYQFHFMTATPENTVMLVSVDMIVCILCALVVLGDMAGKQPRTTWWNNLKLGILIFIIC